MCAVDDRVKKLRQKSQLLSASLRLRLDLEVTRYPADVRQMTMRDYVQHRLGKDHGKKKTTSSSSANGSTAAALSSSSGSSALNAGSRFGETVSKSMLKQAAYNNSVMATPLQRNPNARLYNQQGTFSISDTPMMLTAGDENMGPDNSILLQTPAHHSTRPSSVLYVPLTASKHDIVRKGQLNGKEIQLDLDVNSPGASDRQLDGLDSPARQEVAQHLMKLQQKLEKMISKVTTSKKA